MTREEFLEMLSRVYCVPRKFLDDLLTDIDALLEPSPETQLEDIEGAA